MEWEMQRPSDPNLDAVCFFAQQCIEKWLKALLVEANIPFPKTHDLQKLANLLHPIYPQLTDLSKSLGELTDLTSDVRYPYEFSTTKDASESIAICKNVREILRSVLGPTPLFP
jgi:HEPN domain-containing protein